MFVHDVRRSNDFIYCSPSCTTLFLLKHTMTICFGLFDHNQANIGITSIAEKSYINLYIIFMACTYRVIPLCFSY